MQAGAAVGAITIVLYILFVLLAVGVVALGVRMWKYMDPNKRGHDRVVYIEREPVSSPNE